MSQDIRRIKNSVVWSAIDKIAYSGIQLVLNLILARLILPEEYALVAMISIFIAIGQTFVDSGFSQSLIHKQNRTETDFSTTFYFNVAVAIIFYFLIFSIAPLIADFYNNPIFIPLTRIVALNLIISSFAIVQRAVLTIKTDFKTQALISIISIIISGVIGITMAYEGYGVWAMVVQVLLNHFIIALLLWIVVRWHPLLVFSKKSFLELFSYGSNLLFSKLINTTCQNIYTLLIGKFYVRQEVAYFNNANQLSLYSAGYLNEIIQRALFPIQCEIHDDLIKSKLFFMKMLRLSSFVIFPIMLTMIVLARPFVLTVLTEKWEGMILYMQIIAFAYMWFPLMGSNQMFNVLGRTDLYLRTEIIKKIVFFLIVFITVTQNVTFMCCGIVVYNLMEIVINALYLKKIMPFSFVEVLKNILPAFIFSIITALFVLFVISLFENMFMKLIIGGTISIFIYFLIAYSFKSQDLSDLLKIVKSK